MVSMDELENVAKKLYGLVGFICDAKEEINEIQRKISYIHDESLSFECPEHWRDIELKAQVNIGIFTFVETPTHVRLITESISRNSLVSGDMYAISFATAMYIGRIKPLNKCSERFIQFIRDSARKYKIESILDSGVEFEYREYVRNISEEDIDRINKTLVALLENRKCDVVLTYYDRVEEKPCSLHTGISRPLLDVSTDRDVNLLCSVADWFVKQIVRIYERIF